MNQKKILLIEPPFYRLYKETYSLDRYPLSLGYLAGTIQRETDWSVHVYNADFSPQSEAMQVSYMTGKGFENYLDNLKHMSGSVWKEVESILFEVQPDVIGITMKSQNFASGCLVAKLAKRINKDAIVIVGGPHPTMAQNVLDCKDIDVCVRGEGERTIVELLHAIEREKGFENIAGIVFRRNGGIVENGSRQFIEDLNTLCFPHESAREALIGYEQYPPSAFKNIFASRGCPYNCFFCGSKNIWSRRVRFRSTDNIIKEIISLQSMGVKSVHFDDDTFGIKRENIKELCEAMLVNLPNLKWSCELHIKLVEEDIIALMKDAGCQSVQVGIESGNNEILKKMRKNTTIEEALRACKIIKKHGIQLQTFFMIGLPWETEETIRDTVEAMKRIQSDDVIYSIFTPYPGTEAFEVCKKSGLIGDDYNVSLYNHKSPANSFCLNIDKERFRELAFEVEAMVDRVNRRNKVKRVFSPQVFSKVKEKGVSKSIKTGIKMILGK